MAWVSRGIDGQCSHQFWEKPRLLLERSIGTQGVLELIEQCIVQDPTARPTAAQLLRRLREEG